MDLADWNTRQGLETFNRELKEIDSAESFERLRVAYLGKKNGLIGQLLQLLRSAPPEEKPRLGREVNQFKKAVEGALKNHRFSSGAVQGSRQRDQKKGGGFDVTLPGIRPALGSLHPLTLTLDKVLSFFLRMGYDLGDGPEIETLFYNFEALNTPQKHPAREEADTFYIDDDRLLRTQTSGVQIRYMQTHQPPFRMIAPGKVYRRDDDITHSPMFQQLEGLVVGHRITFGHLKGTLEAFAKFLFGAQTRIRLRPSFFPFTEPSAEVDVSCPFCTSGCRVCKNTRWIEILGCGMVDPNVFGHVGYDSEEITGFAFGIGIERIAMLNMGIPDIRLFYQNDRRFLDQFKMGD